jgi:tRNA (mo5U34)-methyltransferase
MNLYSKNLWHQDEIHYEQWRLQHCSIEQINNQNKARDTYLKKFCPLPLKEKVRLAWELLSREQWQEGLIELIPWKKGPFQYHDIFIDSEWRSDLKWERVKSALSSEEIENKSILDIGGNNGHYLFSLFDDFRKTPPLMALNLDPVFNCYAQFRAIQHLKREKNLFYDLLGLEEITQLPALFDLIFFMGIIYHHPNPTGQLKKVYDILSPQGIAFIETIGIPGELPYALCPDKTYMQMRNISFIPTLSCLVNWCKKARFKKIEIISDTPLTSEEQRTTFWGGENRQSLADYLKDEKTTVEGFPAPRRFLLKVYKGA